MRRVRFASAISDTTPSLRFSHIGSADLHTARRDADAYRASTKRTSTKPADGENVTMNQSAIYSPTTGRQLLLSAKPGEGRFVQILPGTTTSKRPHKRGALVACTFCRRRKIACGGSQERDETGRCG